MKLEFWMQLIHELQILCNLTSYSLFLKLLIIIKLVKKIYSFKEIEAS
jgi:hypothetical protein